MKNLFTILLLCAAPLLFADQPIIKVLLAKEVPAVLLEAKGAYQVQRKENGDVLSFGSQGKRFVCHSIQDGIRWGEEYPECTQITLVPRNEETCVYVDGMQYKGAISVYREKQNRVTVVNEVPLDDYLVSVLALDFDAPIKEEAMAAYTIAARTNAYASMLQGAKKRWDVAAADVGYYGLGVTARKNGVESVIERTKHMILSAKDGSPARNKGLTLEHAQELVDRGFDAKRILTTAFPHTQVSVAKEVR